MPAVIVGSQFVYDLIAGAYVYGFAFNDAPMHYKVTAPHPAAMLSPEALATDAAR